MLQLRNSLLGFCGLLFLAFSLNSCKDDSNGPEVVLPDAKLVADYDAEAALQWNLLFLEAERYAAGYRPGPAPRALAYIGLASYEACVSAMPSYNSLESNFAGLNIPDADASQEYHWPTVVHTIYGWMLPKFFVDPPTHVSNQILVTSTNLSNKYLAEAGQEVYDRSKAYGESVAQAVWEWSATDPVGHDAYLDPFGDYNWEDHYDGPGDWEPIAPGPGKPMFAIWGGARRFAISADDRLALPPSAYFMQYSESPTSEYYSQALQVYSKDATTDYEVKWIGEFWSDDLLNLTFSPGPRWVAIANQVIINENTSLEQAIEAYAKIGLALNDAAVACWHSKYYYNVERPATYIRKVIDPDYKSNLNNPITGDEGITPSFPAYPSGHSTMGAAAAEALADVFGYAYAMTDRCHENRNDFEGTPRSFTSFEQMAEENAWSRVLLGVHWRMDSDEGIRLGKAIGQKVNKMDWKK